MSDATIQNVPDTAFMAAAYRAIESERPDALFRDPLADKLAGERGRAIIASLPPQAMMGGWTVIIRTCIIDALIQQAITQGVDTILNLGAGLDTRPYRMALPETLRWIEVDHPAIIEWKRARLAQEKPRCQLESIALDLADAQARRQLLDEVANRSGKVLVLTEAVTPYLPEEAVAALGADLGARAAIKYWIVDYFSLASYEYRRRSGMSRAMKNAPFLFEPKDYFGFFALAGWQPKEIKYFAEEAQHLRRRAPFPWQVRLITAVLGMLMPPEKRRAMKQYAGFVLFEPATKHD
ncbi:MAG: SAM-dependent methyltransferase [Gammaproteobacteria bacterium]|nr:SAM-dependent methyltransferase [Gammaproteobacteria bacterium]MBU1777789.1 SAM-dependent methyltransferase [Gammaproteobacteria bacterium]MBU1969682.1 SAM-dependent methyltransferase [Gammaproteobacteria bacterium]